MSQPENNLYKNFPTKEDWGKEIRQWWDACNNGDISDEEFLRHIIDWYDGTAS